MCGGGYVCVVRTTTGLVKYHIHCKSISKNNCHNDIPYLGPFKCYVALFSRKLDPHPPPRNANNVEYYTFVTLFFGKLYTPPPPPHLRYVTLEWPLLKENKFLSTTGGIISFQHNLMSTSVLNKYYTFTRKVM